MAVTALEFICAVGVFLLACESYLPKRQPRVTAVDEEFSPDETLHRLRQFHGHLGPYAVLGYRLGLWILRRLGCEKYFGAHVTVRGPHTTPFTCMLDGIQMATGYTLGKGNLELIPTATDALFDIEVVTEEGRLLRLQVPRQVENTFAEWMAQGLAEQQVFDTVMAEPNSNLWAEES